MDKYLYISMALGTASLIAALVLVLRAPKQAPCVFINKETKSILGLTVLSLGLGYGVEVYKLIDSKVGGEEPGSYGMIAVIGFIAILMAAYTILYAFNKKIYVYEDHMIVSDDLGKARSIEWDEVLSVERPGMQRAAKFSIRGGYSFTVYEANKNYKRFMNYLEPRLKEVKGKHLMAQIEKNLM